MWFKISYIYLDNVCYEICDIINVWIILLAKIGTHLLDVVPVCCSTANMFHWHQPWFAQVPQVSLIKITTWDPQHNLLTYMLRLDRCRQSAWAINPELGHNYSLKLLMRHQRSSRIMGKLLIIISIFHLVGWCTYNQCTSDTLHWSSPYEGRTQSVPLSTLATSSLKCVTAVYGKTCKVAFWLLRWSNVRHHMLFTESFIIYHIYIYIYIYIEHLLLSWRPLN